MKPALIALITIAVLVGGGVFLANSNRHDDAAETNETATEMPPTDQSAASTETESITAADGTTVRYDGSSYAPASVTVAAGETVTFVNESNTQMWTASDDHPTHLDYAAFDADKGIAPGATYSFTFKQAGTWGFHDHLNPSITGSVTVE